MSFLFSGGLFDVIPDSAIHHYPTGDFTASNWPDDIGSSDIDTINGLTYDDTAFGGDGGVVGDGVNDYGTSDTMGAFMSSSTDPFAVAFRFSTTDSGNVLIGASNTTGGSGSTVFLIGTQGFEGGNSDKLMVQFRDEDLDKNVVQSEQDVSDGGDYKVIIQRESAGGDASDIQIYFESGAEQDIVSNEGYSNPADFAVDVAYFAWNNESSGIQNNIDAEMREPIWFNDSLDQSERESVFGLL